MVIEVSGFFKVYLGDRICWGEIEVSRLFFRIWDANVVGVLVSISDYGRDLGVYRFFFLVLVVLGFLILILEFVELVRI